jgi:GNAT superfamily N-acetyltransferase
MLIRRATPDDAGSACDVLRRSIAELCHADHGGKADLIESWLANKTPENVRAWIADPDNRVLVACVGAAIAGVGAVSRSGHISLNYVAPQFRFRGVSKGLLARLEEEARKLGARTCTLSSTETARKFYRSAGYVADGPSARAREGVGGYPMRKRLQAT